MCVPNLRKVSNQYLKICRKKARKNNHQNFKNIFAKDGTYVENYAEGNLCTKFEEIHCHCAVWQITEAGFCDDFIPALCCSRNRWRKRWRHIEPQRNEDQQCARNYQHHPGAFWDKLGYTAAFGYRYSGNRTACASVEKQRQTDFTGKNWGLSKRDSRDKGIRGAFAAVFLYGHIIRRFELVFTIINYIRLTTK